MADCAILPVLVPTLRPPALPSLPWPPLPPAGAGGCFWPGSRSGGKQCRPRPAGIQPLLSPLGKERTSKKGRFSGLRSEPEAVPASLHAGLATACTSAAGNCCCPGTRQAAAKPPWTRGLVLAWCRIPNLVPGWYELHPLLGGKGLRRVRHPGHRKGVMASSRHLVLRCLLRPN